MTIILWALIFFTSMVGLMAASSSDWPLSRIVVALYLGVAILSAATGHFIIAGIAAVFCIGFYSSWSDNERQT